MSIDVRAKFAKPSCFLGSSYKATKCNIGANVIMIGFLMDYIDWYIVVGIFTIVQMLLAMMFYNNPYFVEEISLVFKRANGKAKDEDGEFYV